MIIKLCSLTKRINSTKRPSEYSVEVDVQLKSNCSSESPVFLIKDSVWDNSYNYMYIPEWDSYYFLDDATIQTGMIWQTSWSMDALATYKTEIGNYTAFVERAASSYDTSIIDSALSMKQNIIKSESVTTALTHLNTRGCYLIRTVSGELNYSSVSGINTYVTVASQLPKIFDFMFDADNFTDVITDNVVKTFFNPFQYIIDIRWFPFDAGVLYLTQPVQHAVTSIKFGWWSVPGLSETFLLTQKGAVISAQNINIPTPQYSDWRGKTGSWTRYNMFLPVVGNINLDPAYASDGIDVSYGVDFATGYATVKVKTHSTTSEKIISTHRVNMCVPIQIAQIGSPLESVISGGLGVITSALTHNIIGGVGSAVSGIAGSFSPEPSTNGANGDMYAISNNPNIVVTMYCYEAAEYPLSVYGKPLCQNVQLSTLSGFVQCANASVPIASIRSEKNAVDGYLNSGFYME